MKVDLNKYKEFVEGVTSEESNDWAFTQARLHELNDEVNISLIIEQLVLPKEVNMRKLLKNDSPRQPWMMKQRIKRELGDIIWYWINSCRALDSDPNEVIAEMSINLRQDILAVNLMFYYLKIEKKAI